MFEGGVRGGFCAARPRGAFLFRHRKRPDKVSHMSQCPPFRRTTTEERARSTLRPSAHRYAISRHSRSSASPTVSNAAPADQGSRTPGPPVRFTFEAIWQTPCAPAHRRRAGARGASAMVLTLCTGGLPTGFALLIGNVLDRSAGTLPCNGVSRLVMRIPLHPVGADDFIGPGT